MSDELDAFREVDDAAAVDAGEAPELVYGSVDEFVREYLRHMYTRPVGGGNARYRWAAKWWKFPEAVARLEGLWRSWEHLRQDPRPVRAPGGRSTPIITCRSFSAPTGRSPGLRTRASRVIRCPTRNHPQGGSRICGDRFRAPALPNPYPADCDPRRWCRGCPRLGHRGATRRALDTTAWRGLIISYRVGAITISSAGRGVRAPSGDPRWCL